MEFHCWRDGKHVGIHIIEDIGYGANKKRITHSFWREYADELIAQQMATSISRCMENRTEELIAEAYELGWRDKSSKKKKRTSFTFCINTSPYEEDAIAWRDD